MYIIPDFCTLTSLSAWQLHELGALSTIWSSHMLMDIDELAAGQKLKIVHSPVLACTLRQGRIVL